MKKSLSIFSLACCQGCSLQVTNDLISFTKLSEYYNVLNIEDESDLMPLDIALVEGSVENKQHETVLRKIRKFAKTVIAIGSCAHMGGVQSQRRRLPKKLHNGNQSQNIRSIIKVDYTIPGCPIDRNELYRNLMDLYWGKSIALPDLAVCFECRQNENECLLKQGKICLGPVTRMGCGSVCPNNKEACLGCRGKISDPNIEKMKEALSKNIETEKTEHILSFFGDQNAR